MTTVDYKETLNLPKTDFPMRGNLPQKEPLQLTKWQEMDLYDTVQKANKGKKKFILHLGPPYANGDIHIGHAVTTTLKDIIVKSKLLSGYDSPLVPGWDCHGLPIEVNVEKKIGLANVDVSAEAFRDACREYANSQIALQMASLKRLGILADWENPYKTLHHEYEADIIRSLGKILEQGHLHQGAKPVHWCLNCGSALAEAEVEYQDKTSPAIDVCFKVKDTTSFLEAIGCQANINAIAVLIWTTTPWTLPANQAVALHPNLDYVLVSAKINDKYDTVCLIEPLLEATMARYGIEDYTVLATFKGKQVEKHLLEHPFLDKTSLLVLGEHVTTDAGTGAVHTAPAHGLDDYLVGAHYGLEVDTIVADNGCFSKDVPLLGGMHVFKANAKIIEILKEKQNLAFETTLSHSYPHCWRHKTPLIFRATSQWFISMEKNALRQDALKAVEQVQWVPSWGQSRMQLMLEGRPDWCISRQRTWGVPLPLFTHKTTNELHPQMVEIVEYVAKRVEEKGIEAWHELNLSDMPFTSMEEYTKSTDILDVWFESGASHEAVLRKREALQFPADLYLEGSDQHRGWFQTSLLSSMAMQKQAPYKAVLTHGFTVDAKGRKMSKSLGNVVAPEKVIKNLGADVLRLWVSATDYKGEIHVSDEILKRTSDAYRRIRNTLRFLLANLNGFEPQEHVVEQDKLLALDLWIVDCAAKLQDELVAHYNTYQFHQIYQKIHNFCVVELGSFYLDIIKDRQYTLPENSVARRSAQTAMHIIANALVRWLAPILSFTAEEAWQYLPGAQDKEASIFMTQWYKDFPRLQEQRMNDSFWQRMMGVRNAVNKALEAQRASGAIGAPLNACVTLYAKGALYESLKALDDELRFVLITSMATVLPFEQKPKTALVTELSELFLEVTPSDYEKCARCWHHLEDVNQHEQYPGICGRCVINITTKHGEERFYA